LGAVDLAQCRSRNDVDAVLAARIAHPGVRQFLLKNVGRPTPDTLAWKFNLNVLIRNYVEITRALPPEFTYAGPVLFVRGGLSGYMEEQELPLLRAHFPQAQLETVPQAGHWVHAEQPEAFSSTVMNFLQTIPAPTEPGNS